MAFRFSKWFALDINDSSVRRVDYRKPDVMLQRFVHVGLYLERTCIQVEVDLLLSTRNLNSSGSRLFSYNKTQDTSVNNLIIPCTIHSWLKKKQCRRDHKNPSSDSFEVQSLS